MKIAHIIFTLNTGGAESMLVDIINEQVKTESVLLIVVNNTVSNLLLSLIDNRVNIVLIGRKEKSRNPVSFIKLNWQLFLIRPDVIHCHDQAVINMIILRKNATLTVHGINIPTNNFKYYKTIFAISNAVKIDIEKRSNINAILIHNGVKIDDIKSKTNYTFGVFRIVQVGRLDHEIKGQHILIKALKILIYEMNVKNICVDFIGDGKSKNYLKEIVKVYQLDKFVNFLGNRERVYIYENLQSYNLLIQPSLCEGFGLTIAEAMAAKIPVLVSDSDGPFEIVDGGNFGRIFKSGNFEHCANEILDIYNTYEQVSKVCNKSYKQVEKLFNLIDTSRLYQKQYKFLSNK